MQFVCNFDGRCLEITMGHLVELGKIVFGYEMLAECFFAPPDTCEKKYVSNFSKQFQKMFQTMFEIMFEKVSKHI